MKCKEATWPWQGHVFDRPAWSPGITSKDDGLHRRPENRYWFARCSRCNQAIELEPAFSGGRPPDPVMAAIVLWRDTGNLPNKEDWIKGVKLSHGQFVIEMGAPR